MARSNFPAAAKKHWIGLGCYWDRLQVTPAMMHFRNVRQQISLLYYVM